MGIKFKINQMKWMFSCRNGKGMESTLSSLSIKNIKKQYTHWSWENILQLIKHSLKGQTDLKILRQIMMWLNCYSWFAVYATTMTKTLMKHKLWFCHWRIHCTSTRNWKQQMMITWVQAYVESIDDFDAHTLGKVP